MGASEEEAACSSVTMPEISVEGLRQCSLADRERIRAVTSRPPADPAASTRPPAEPAPSTRPPTDPTPPEPRRPGSLRDGAPLLDGYLSFRESEATPFTTPGHKGRASKLDEELGIVVAGDVPLYGGVDTIKSSGGLLASAEAGRRGGMAPTGAVSRPGGRRTATRRCASRSASPATRSSSLARSTGLSCSGLVLADLVPCWLPTTLDPATGMPLGVAVEDV